VFVQAKTLSLAWTAGGFLYYHLRGWPYGPGGGP